MRVTFHNKFHDTEKTIALKDCFANLPKEDIYLMIRYHGRFNRSLLTPYCNKKLKEIECDIAGCNCPPPYVVRVV